MGPSSTEVNTSPYAQQRASGNSLCDAGNPKQVLCDNLEGWNGEGGLRGGGNTCIPTVDSC